MKELSAIDFGASVNTLRTTSGVLQFVNVNEKGQIQQPDNLEMPMRVQDIHSKFINRLLQRADKTTNLTQRIKVRQLARDVSSRTLNRDIRSPLYRPLTDLSARRTAPEDLVMKSSDLL